MLTDIKSSGKRRFSTGSKRDSSDGKPKPGLIPPFIQTLLGVHYAKGAVHYGLRDWEKGQPISELIESVDRHWLAWKNGLTDEPHLIAVIWNVIAICYVLLAIKCKKLPKTLDDRPWHMKENNPLGKEIYDGIFAEIEQRKKEKQHGKK